MENGELPPEPVEPTTPEPPASSTTKPGFKDLAFKALGYFFCLFFLFLLVKATLEGFQHQSSLKWWILGGLVLSLGTAGLMFWKKRDIWEIVRVPVAVFILLVVYSALFYSTSDLKAFTVFGRATESLLNPVFLLVLLALIFSLWFKSKLPRWFKITATVALTYCALPFFYGMLRGVGLEDSFLGVDFFSYIPWYFLQPIYLTIHVVFPLAFVLALFFFFKNRRGKPTQAKLFLAVGLLVLVTDAIGFVAMMRNRVPNAFSWLFSAHLGVGEATTTFVDPRGQTVTARITTKNFDEERKKENAEFYTMALSYKQSEGDKRLFGLSIKDSAGKDVLFLGTDDFQFSENGNPQEPHAVLFELGGVKTGQNVILVLDHSGSMSDVIDKLKLAAKSFIDLKNRNDQILLVPFSAKANPVPITKDATDLKANIDKIRSGGGTSLYQAILTGYDLGEKLPGQTTMVIMTDGKATDKSKDREAALEKKLASHKLTLYSVGLGTTKELDEPFLEKLAKDGGGKYYRTEDAGKLKDIYQAIGAELQAKYTGWYLHQAQAPILKITSPSNGGMVTTPTNFTAGINNFAEAEVAKVEFFLDGQKIGEQPGNKQAAYTIPLDPGSLVAGKHLLKAVATSPKSQTSEDSIGIEVQAPIEFKIVRPAEGDSVTGVAPVESSVVIRSDATLSQVNYFIDGTPLGSASQAPYSVTWDTQAAPAGEHVVKGEAVFNNGTTRTHEIKVKVGKDLAMQWSTPVNGVELGNSTPLAVQFSGEDPNDPVVKVQYNSGDTMIGTVETAPFGMSWDTSTLGAGNYPLRATAVTKSGKSVSSTISAKVSTGKLVVNLEGGESSGEAGGKAKFFFPPENLELILDVSNSMWAQLPDGSKIDIAKSVLSNIVEQIPEKTNVAFRIYGGKSPVSRNDCNDSELLLPLSPLNRATILQKIQSLVPTGKTPIAYSLSQVPQDLAAGKGSSVVLLITDGIESCNGDPVAAAAQLHQAGIKPKIHVIGYDVGNEKEKADLGKIATAGGGKFFSATTTSELKDAIVEAASADFRVLDTQGKALLQAPVGATVYDLKSGTYKLSVDLAPPLVLDSLVIRPNQTTTVTVQRTPSGFQLIQK